MKLILKLEEFALWIGCVTLLYVSQADWWWYALMFLGPDVSMLGYLVNTKVGAWSYNLFHHKAIAILVILSGLILHYNYIFGDSWLVHTGFVLFGHSSMDRFFGYGLKYENGFKFTHLGEIGKK
ncbi:MAG: DUF4260 domain-containing protein [Lacibacter sp.]|jgi:hypothetical protein